MAQLNRTLEEPELVQEPTQFAITTDGIAGPMVPGQAMTTQAPITAKALPLKPPEPVDTFTPMFRKAVQDERFAALPDEERWKFVNLLMDDDEQLKGLDERKRRDHIQSVIKQFQAEEEEESRFSRRLQRFAETPMGQAFLPGAAGVLERSEALRAAADVGAHVPVLSNLGLSGTGGGLRSVGAIFGGLETGAQFFEKNLKGDKYDPEKKRFFGHIADALTAQAEMFPQGTREGAAEWVARGVGGTFGFLGPSVAVAGLTGGGTLVPMAMALTGETRQEVLEETGALEDPGIVMASGFTQAVLERLVGPESRIGANLFRNGIRSAFDRITTRAATRVGLEALAEAGTEGAQEWLSQQTGEWSAGDRGWWNNLEPEEKREISEGILLGGIIGGMVATPGNLSSAVVEKRLERLSGLLQDMESLSPEERGAAGLFDPRRLKRLSTAPLTEDQEAQLRLEHAPEFLKDDTRLLDQFAKGTLVPGEFTSEQQAEIAAAEEAIRPLVEREDVAVEAATDVGEVATQAAFHIQNEANRMADVWEERGNPERAAKIRAASESLQLVDPKAPELRELAGAIESFGGIKVQFYRADQDLGINGVTSDPGTILVKWDSTAPEVVAHKAVHEAVHAIARGNKEAEAALVDMVRETNPDLVKEIEAKITHTYETRESELSPARLQSETAATIGEVHAADIFKAMRQRALSEKDWAKEPKGVQRMIEGMWEWARKLSRKSDLVTKLIGKQPEAFDPSKRRQFAQMMDGLLSYLEGTRPAPVDVKVGDKPTPVPKKIAPTPSKITLEEEAAPEPKKAKPKKAKKKAEKKPVPEEPETVPDDDHGQGRLFSFEQQAKQEIKSGATSIRNVPDAMKAATWERGTRNADIGGGAFENATNYLRSQGVENLVWDPYSRSAEHNREVAKALEEAPADTGTMHNVLNVIREREARIEALQNLLNAVKDGGTVSIAINELAGDGKGRETKTGWQNNQPAEFYLPEVEEVFGNATLKNGVITAVKGDPEEIEVEKLESDAEFSLQLAEDLSPPPSDEMGLIWPAGSKAFRLYDDDTLLTGRLIARERYQGTPDQEIYVEWVDVRTDDEGTPLYGEDRQTKLGIRRVMALREQIAPFFPNAIWMGGLRISGIREAQDVHHTKIYTRIPVVPKAKRDARGITLERGKVTQDQLDERHGPDEEGEDPLDPTVVFEQSMETLDNLINDRHVTGQMADLGTALNLFDENDLRLLTRDNELEDMLRNFGLGDSDVEHSFDWEGDAPDYVALSRDYNVPNLAGFRPLEEIYEGVWRGDGRTFYHLSKEDRTGSGLSLEFAGTASAGQELRRIKAGGERAVHLYVPGVKPEVNVAQSNRVLHRVRADLKLLDTRSTEAASLREGVADTDAFIRAVKEAGYDGLIDSQRGFVQVYRDIKSDEIAEARSLEPGEMKMRFGSTRVPGGLEGTFTYEELIWLKEQAIDVRGLPEDIHLALHEKIVRSLTPEKGDTLQTLNNFIFSMLSPNQLLTPNELAYAVVRVQNEEQSQEWAARIPWDAPSGQEPSLEVLQEDENREEVERYITREFNQSETLPVVRDIEDAWEKDPGAARDLYRQFYDERIAAEFRLQAQEEGGMGLLGTASLSSIAELHQYYQIDPEWFLMQDTDAANGMPSWHTYIERLSTQFRGMGTKVASFAAVWQDPTEAAISAIDRHMGRMFLPHLFETDTDRLDWERGVVYQWNEANPGEKVGNLDELFLRSGGDSHFVKALIAKLGTKKQVLFTQRGKKPETLARQIMEGNPDLPEHWRKWMGSFISLPEHRRIELMSDAYREALAYNAREARRLGLGLFSSQWYLWDRYRRRLEPHEINFPGLYKLPHLSQDRIAAVRRAHSEAGYLDRTPEQIETESGPEIHLKRVRPAPPGDLAYWSFDEGPAHFPPSSSRTPLFNAQQAFPSAVLDPQSGPMWSLPDESWLGYMRRRIQDKFFRVRVLQESIEREHGSIHDDMDAYLHEMLYHGRAAARIEEFEDKFVKPLMDFIRKNNIDIEDFEMWLHARHAPERNKHYRDVWYTRKKARLEEEIRNLRSDIAYAESRGSDAHILKRRLKRKQENLRGLSDQDIPWAGMSDEDAAKILEGAGDKYDEVGKLFDAMMARKLEILWEGDLINENQLKAVSQYKFYVPLKGKNYEGDLEDLLDTMGVATGRGFDIRGDELGFAFGFKQGERHTHPILPQAVVDIEEAIIRAEKNRVGQAFLALVEEFPNDDLYEINKDVHRRVWDKATGEVRLVKDAFANRADNVLSVKRDGEEFYITIKDARLASAMKNIGSEPMGAAIKIMAGINRFLAKVNTTLNPEFMIANFLRDLQTAGFNLSTEELKSLRDAALGNIPAAVNGIRKAEGFTTDPDAESDPWVQRYHEFVKEGGKIGFFGYNDVLSKARAIDRQIKRAGPGAVNMGIRHAMAVGSVIERGNTVVENATRLSAYVAAREAGMSKKRAAALARNLTVNFNKKGEAGQIMNAIWLFSNASIQGTFRMGHAVLRSPSVQKLVAAQVVGSFAMAALNRGIAGEDEEDGMNYWDKLGDWHKERNLVIMIPGQGDHIKIPLPYGYNIFHVLGTEMERLVWEGSQGRLKGENVTKAAANMFNALMTAFNPLGGSSLDTKWTAARFLVPSQIAPIADTLVNETYYGAPIQPVRSSWDHSPKSARYFKSVTPLSRDLTKYLNKWTGGSEYESGWIDMNPEVLDYIAGSYAGAGAKTATRFVFKDVGWLAKALAGKDPGKLEANDIVFLRRVYGEQNDSTVAAVFYENIDDLKQAQKAYENLRGKERKAWREKHGWMVTLFNRMKDAEKGIRATDDPDAKNRIRKRFNRYYREAWLSQF